MWNEICYPVHPKHRANHFAWSSIHKDTDRYLRGRRFTFGLHITSVDNISAMTAGGHQDKESDRNS